MANVLKTFLNDVAGGFFGNDYLRDFTHASKTFRSSFYNNAPKFKFLFHVYFELNELPSISVSDQLIAQQFTNFFSENVGLLVKSVRLPSYTILTEQKNQYNRKRIVQTKINYDPIDITFHDDNRNLISGLWYRYYRYYYNDADNPKVMFKGNRGGASERTVKGGGVQAEATGANYNYRNIYSNTTEDELNWGYIGEKRYPSTVYGVKLPFFKNITIFGLSRHNFIAYTLINPMITRFSHDTYNYDESGVMQHTMTLDYETVVYNQGFQDGRSPSNIITGFGEEATYDKRLSPISEPGSNSNVLGQFGLIDSAGGAIQGILSGDPGEIISSIRTAGKAYNSFKNVNLKQSLQEELKTIANNALANSGNSGRKRVADIPLAKASPTNNNTGSPNPIQQYGQILDRATQSVTGVLSQTFGSFGAIGTPVSTAGVQVNTPER